MINIRPEPLANRRCLRSLPIIQNLMKQSSLLFSLLFQEHKIWQYQKYLYLICIIILTQEHLNVYFEELLICRALFWDD